MYFLLCEEEPNSLETWLNFQFTQHICFCGQWSHYRMHNNRICCTTLNPTGYFLKLQHRRIVNVAGNSFLNRKNISNFSLICEFISLRNRIVKRANNIMICKHAKWINRDEEAVLLGDKSNKVCTCERFLILSIFENLRKVAVRRKLMIERALKEAVTGKSMVPLEELLLT